MNPAQASSGKAPVPVCMERPTLLHLPDFAPPRGWSVRWYQTGDEANWFRIQLAAEQQHASNPELFRNQFGDDDRLLTQRQCYLQNPQGEVVGTATAWFDDAVSGPEGGARLPPRAAARVRLDGALGQPRPTIHPRLLARGQVRMDQGVFQGGRWGRVHWVAILPEHQGQGLGSPLMAAVCHRLRDLGHTRAFLRTAANRLPAIKLYLRFGFEPHPRSVEEGRVWRDILPALGRAA